MSIFNLFRSKMIAEIEQLRKEVGSLTSGLKAAQTRIDIRMRETQELADVVYKLKEEIKHLKAGDSYQPELWIKAKDKE